MASRIETFFSEAEREAIRAATAAAERKTSGELVVYIVDRCDPHPEVPWKSTLLGGAIGAVVAATGIFLFGGWGARDDLWLLIGVQLGLLLGWLASRADRVARSLVGDEALESRVDGRAAEAFVEERVFETEKRTGVLIFVALFEHRVVVLADDGIREQVPSDAWDGIAREVATGIREGHPAAALIEAVGRCAELLSAHGVPANTTNELSNEPRFRDE